MAVKKKCNKMIDLKHEFKLYFEEHRNINFLISCIMKTGLYVLYTWLIYLSSLIKLMFKCTDEVKYY